MSLIKRITATVCSVALVTCLGAGLTACGSNGVAAKWAHGEVTEEEVTNAVQNMRANYASMYEQYGLTWTDDNWDNFVAEHLYDEDYDSEEEAGSEDESTDESTEASTEESTGESTEASTEESTEESTEASTEESTEASTEESTEESTEASTDESTEASTEESTEASTEEADGRDCESTEEDVAALREYVAEQLVRQDVIEWAADDAGITVSEEEVEEYIADTRTSYEQQYAGGMSGTFESILERYYGTTLEEFEANAADELKILKLQEQQVGVNENDSTWDEDKWNAYVDGLMDYADLQITDAPSNLEYDPAVIAESAEASTEASTEEDAAEEDAAEEGTNAEDAESDDASADASTAESTSEGN